MSEESTIRVNFGRPLPLFPLNTVVLMPHSVHPFHIFEERYRQMVSDALDGAGQIAMAVFEGSRWRQEYHGRPPLRPGVCIGQILQHYKLPDGRYHVALQGVCRARIAHELPPAEDRLYRAAMLEPVGLAEIDESDLGPYRERFASMLGEWPLTDLRDAATVIQHLPNSEVPTSALLEVITLSFISDSEVRYRLLAEPDSLRRAQIIKSELERLRTVLRRAAPQRAIEVPKGCSWN